MRKLFTLISAAIMLAGCADDFIGTDELCEQYVMRSFDASLGEFTKTELDASGKVSWASGDVIRYYSQDNGSIQKAVITDPEVDSKLDLKVSAGSSYIIGVFGGSSLYENSSSCVSIRDAVTPVQDGTFGGQHVAVAKTDNVSGGTLAFKNVVTYIKFTFERDDIKKVVFTARDGVRMHGDGLVKVVFNGDAIAASYPSSGGSTITVNNNGAGTFYLATLPCTMYRGFDIDCYDASDMYVGTVQTMKMVTVNQDRVLNLGVLDARIRKNYLDLSSQGTANCYVVSQSHSYKIRTTKGNSNVSVGQVAYAKVLWESYGNDYYPKANDLVKEISSDPEYIYFSASARHGNALIAAMDSHDNILWSWHIWMTEIPENQLYFGGAGTLMDRNLGATSAVPGAVEANGLMYQWGRKDPMVPASIGYTIQCKVPDFICSVASAADQSGSALAYSIANPLTFITADSNSGYDWYSKTTSGRNDNLWRTTKTIYDPCPAGYRVAEGGESGVWTTAMNASPTYSVASDWDSVNYGMNFGNTTKKFGSSPIIWYPAAGYLNYDSSHVSVNTMGAYWSCTASGTNAYGFAFNYKNTLYKTDSYRRVYGRSIRCKKI